MIIITTQCFPPDVGGIETLMRDLARAASAAGRDVHVLADAAGPDAAAWDAAEPYAVTRVAGLKPQRRHRKAYMATELAHGALASGARPLLIADSWKSASLMPRRRLTRDIRLHCLAHGMEFPRAPGPIKAARIAAALAKANLILANSDWTADQAFRFAGKTPVRVATPPITPPPPAEAEEVERLRAELAPTGGPLVVSLARLEPRKGVDRMIEAVTALAPHHPGLRYVVAGDGPDRARLEDLAASNGAPEGAGVCFLGRVTDSQKSALLSAADVFAMPNRREGDSVEGFGIVYGEAAALGTPSLAGRDGGAASAVIDGETGLLCDGSDPKDVRTVLARLLDDAEFRARLGAAAQSHANRQSWALRLADYTSEDALSADPEPGA